MNSRLYCIELYEKNSFPHQSRIWRTRRLKPQESLEFVLHDLGAQDRCDTAFTAADGTSIFEGNFAAYDSIIAAGGDGTAARIVQGLAARCTKGIYLAYSELGIGGEEQSGRLQRVLMQSLARIGSFQGRVAR